MEALKARAFSLLGCEAILVAKLLRDLARFNTCDRRWTSLETEDLSSADVEQLVDLHLEG